MALTDIRLYVDDAYAEQRKYQDAVWSSLNLPGEAGAPCMWLPALVCELHLCHGWTICSKASLRMAAQQGKKPSPLISSAF